MTGSRHGMPWPMGGSSIDGEITEEMLALDLPERAL